MEFSDMESRNSARLPRRKHREDPRTTMDNMARRPGGQKDAREDLAHGREC